MANIPLTLSDKQWILFFIEEGLSYRQIRDKLGYSLGVIAKVAKLSQEDTFSAWFSKYVHSRPTAKRERQKAATRAKHKVWRDKNRDKVREHVIKWQRKNPHKVNERRARKLKAIPPWQTEDDKDLIKGVYQQAALLTKQTGIQHHVDHIIPLNGKAVCGLHVHDNLQVLDYRENLSKSNKFEK